MTYWRSILFALTWAILRFRSAIGHHDLVAARASSQIFHGRWICALSTILAGQSSFPRISRGWMNNLELSLYLFLEPQPTWYNRAKLGTYWQVTHFRKSLPEDRLSQICLFALKSKSRLCRRQMTHINQYTQLVCFNEWLEKSRIILIVESNVMAWGDGNFATETQSQPTAIILGILGSLMTVQIVIGSFWQSRDDSIIWLPTMTLCRSRPEAN
jgi:hypothetical protein